VRLALLVAFSIGSNAYADDISDANETVALVWRLTG
jgi:hypothetical protein